MGLRRGENLKKQIGIYLVPYVCDKCSEVLGPRTWDDSMPVGEVNETCPRCGDNHITVFGLRTSTPKVKTSEM
jgi:predicted RNA-binding Zn-ribbon protein involved in translation (DUF1610 family)